MDELESSPPDEDNAGALSRRQTTRLVRRWISARRPAAVVRFGEGEGRLLAAEPGNQVSERVAIRKLRRQTGLSFSPTEMFKVKALILNALDQADILGLRVSADFPGEYRQWSDRIATAYVDRLNRGRTPAYLGHCLLNSDLYAVLPKLLEEKRQLSVVSCRDVQAVLEESYNATDIAMYQIPSQYVVRDVDGPYEGALHGVAIWPDFYYALRAELTVRSRGEVFLVGAGLFGKELCVRIRDLGGIALDMGSTLDAMSGKATRGRNRPDFRPPPEVPRLV